MTEFVLHPDVDAAALAARFAVEGRVRIRPFLRDDVALAVHAHLRQQEHWVQVVNSDCKVFELSRTARAELAPAQAKALDDAVVAGAREGFQYRYETIRLRDGGQSLTIEDDPLSAFTSWLSEPALRELLTRITGRTFAFVDGQATAYSPGDFLTGHDDDVAGKQRIAAYVFGLTPVWRTEWGGLLLFHDNDGLVTGRVPGFNSLDLFSVPQLHSVSMVTRSAAYRRYAITGWLRNH